LGLETHVKHAISLVENEEANIAKADTATLHQVDKTTGSGREEIATTLNLSELSANVGTTVHDGRLDPRSVSELSGLVVDLRDELTSGSEDERAGVCFPSAEAALSHLGGRWGWAVGEESRKDGEEETTRFTGTGLGTAHEITAELDNGDGVLLNGGRVGVARELDVFEEVSVDGRRGECGHRLGNVSSTGLDGDVTVLVEVDTHGLVETVAFLTEELLLKTGIVRGGNVLTVLPLTCTVISWAGTVSAAVASTPVTARGGCIPTTRSATRSAAVEAAECSRGGRRSVTVTVAVECGRSARAEGCS